MLDRIDQVHRLDLPPDDSEYIEKMFEELLTPATEVHHVRPVEEAFTLAEREQRMYDPHNLLALCHNCHVQAHSESKDRAVKPAANLSKSAGLWKGKGVTGLSMSISFEGLRCYQEAENGFEEISAEWGKGQSVEVEAFKRENDATPYVKGKFVITSIEETSPAQDDATYSGSLENDGEPEIYPGKTASNA